MKKIVVFDLDNCISEDNWRAPAINHQHPDVFLRYHRYHSLSPYDEPRNTFMVTHHVSRGEKIVIVTARPEIYRFSTEGWLTKHGVQYDEILMRPDDDHSHSVDLKIKLISEAGYSVDEIEIAYDDRYDVVEAYGQAGIKAERLFIHDEIHGEQHNVK